MVAANGWVHVAEAESDGKPLVAGRNRPDASGPAVLSPREAEVAACVALGWSNKLTAYTLGIAVSSVANELRRAQVKLSVRTRSELIRRIRPLILPGVAPDPSVAARLALLTPSERAVAVRIASGETNDRIARERRCSPRTVANQVAAIFAKLGVGSRAALAALMTDVTGRSSS